MRRGRHCDVCAKRKREKKITKNLRTKDNNKMIVIIIIFMATVACCSRPPPNLRRRVGGDVTPQYLICIIHVYDVMYSAADDDIRTRYLHARIYIYLCARSAAEAHANSPVRRQCCLRRLWRTSTHGDPTALAEQQPPRNNYTDQTVVILPPPPPPPFSAVVVAHPPATSTVHADDSRARTHVAAAVSSHVLFFSDQPSGTHCDNNIQIILLLISS